jgi:ATPases with chaperone activity, ATP-binding subunit
MTFDNFTQRAQEAIQQAQQIATGYEQQMVDTCHLLKALLGSDDKVADTVLKKIGVNTVKLLADLDTQIRSYAKGDTSRQTLTSDANRALQRAKKEAMALGDEYISVELVLLGILMGSDRTARTMRENGAEEQALRKAITELRKGARVSSQSAENEYNALKKYAVNLNEQAEKGKLDPIIGRDEEIRRILQILSRGIL